MQTGALIEKLPMMTCVIGFCIENDGFCITNDGFCITNDGLCMIKNNELCIKAMGFAFQATDSIYTPVRLFWKTGSVRLDTEE